jgi:hypothetical protein
MPAVQTGEQQMKLAEPHVGTDRPPKKPLGRAIASDFQSHFLHSRRIDREDEME